MKAALFNLLLYTHGDAHLAYFKEVARLVREQFPCRILFIQLIGESASPGPSATIQTDVQDCELIPISVPEADWAHVPLLVFPQLIPDTPIYLLWGEDPSIGFPLFTLLGKLANRLILDSQLTKNFGTFCQDLLNRIQAQTISCIVDMNWARISGWLEVIGQTFDSPERLSQLAAASHVKISYHSPQTSSFLFSERQAVYLQAWLSYRLGWQFRSFKGSILEYQSRSSTVQIHLCPKENPALQSGEITDLEVLGQADYLCDLSRIEENQVRVYSANQNQCTIPFNLQLPTARSGRRFMQELFYQKMHPDYPNVLKQIVSVDWEARWNPS